MGKRTVYTKITPLPSNVPRQLALDMLHSHAEMIKLNPLVTDVKVIDAPRDAASDEFFSQWYEITEIITWGLGMKKKISFKGVFHDQPWGLQTHTYAPMGTDLRQKFRIGGNQPGEPRETRELGIDTPADGLYLREDVEIICSVPLTASFVKKETKAATGTMIERLTRKAELLDEGKLHAMFENGRLKTSKPSQGPTFSENQVPSPGSPPGSPRPYGSPSFPPDSTFSPATDEKGFGRYRDIIARRESQRYSSYGPQYQQAGYNVPPQYSRPELSGIVEMPGSFYQPDQNAGLGLYPPPLKPNSGGQVFRSELPGDFQHTSLTPARGHPSPDQSQHYQHYPSPNLSQASSNPNMPSRNSSMSINSSNYKTSNPDYPNQYPQQTHPAYRNSSGPPSSQIADWQRDLSQASSEDPNSIRNSTYSNRSSQPPVEPDHQRFSQLSIQATPSSYTSPDPNAHALQSEHGMPSSGKSPDPNKHCYELAQQAAPGAGQISNCPVCHKFDGDEAAVSHHVSTAHGFK
ncbi:hypothetical protein M433DRAFT_155623 [Acidomyces richmondensis BFW]|nr:MAG: hypothetical protein FE78DRAFT_92456 [Acidomyces sp. 'richmondensis']KYG44439.1 hypothetical protein M433DRAFT_155623 [Acidomyces richmondensis BFW]